MTTPERQQMEFEVTDISGRPEQQVGDQRPARQVIATFDNYPDAQRLVDRMSDGGFPVEHVRIIGDDLRTVERVTGRMTKGRAAFAGAASGAWFGLFIGLLFAIFTVGPVWIVTMLIALAIGAFWGAVFGFVAHVATRGERDFSSVETLEARRYEVCVPPQYAADAARYIQMP
ncbi:general stress protein [Mycobacterium sp. 852014-52144_SCH5372336]|uniref:general stress protein n=1 Tax=Mycobacterium sp. 852014-52144_SCH5372336 TaxID=1834115 RepID=UPI001E3BE267|nr:general stress protein [Mycobacterium sp. 852014-52144_SCH5372336]